METCRHSFICGNDGSARGFEKVVTDYIRQNIPEVHILSYSINHGKGFALRKAVSACNSDYILYTDHDFPYTLDSMSRVLECYSEELMWLYRLGIRLIMIVYRFLVV